MTIEEVFKNRDLLITEKRNALKHSDVLTVYKTDESTQTTKAVNNISEDINQLNVKLVINTTNIIDSHMDCHIPNIWNKSVKETKLFFLLQEHEMEFEYVIADSVNDNIKASVEEIEWKKLGFKYQGSTQALVFDATIKKDRNEFMFNQYRKGYVLNHSVGMRYIKIFLCIDSTEPMYASEKANWDKYIGYVVNPEVANEKGYFWAVTEASFVEGSAVVKGSNSATPTLSVGKQDNEEPLINTHSEEPSDDTQQENKQFFINLLK